ncbi:hypothetical protein [Burkholderia cepacia]|uniref:hypothetical protein n=1 Tax=Burkholderia cepacia TaxID=292 RepID=UPI00163B0E2C
MVGLVDGIGWAPGLTVAGNVHCSPTDVIGTGSFRWKKTMVVPISLIGRQETIIVLFSMAAVGRHRVEQTAGLVRDRVGILGLADRRCVFTATRKLFRVPFPDRQNERGAKQTAKIDTASEPAARFAASFDAGNTLSWFIAGSRPSAWTIPRHRG